MKTPVALPQPSAPVVADDAFPPISSEVKVLVDDGDGYEAPPRTLVDRPAWPAGQARAAEERYRALFDGASDTITVISPAGVIQEVNHRWQEVLLIPPEQMVGRRMSDFAAPGEAAANDDIFQASIQKPMGRTAAVPLQRGDGAVIHMEFSMSVIDIDGTSAVLALGHDITDELRSARALAAAEAQYRGLIEGIPDVVWSHNSRGEITALSANAAGLCGFTVAHMMGGGIDFWLGRVHPDDLARVRSRYHDLANSSGAPLELEYRWQRADEAWIWLRSRGKTRHDGQVSTCDGTLVDITQQRQLEDRLRQVQKMDAIGQLSGGVAHEFNNIMATIVASAHFLTEGMAENDPRHAEAGEITAAVERGSALTRQLLAFSSRQILEPRVISLDAVVLGIENLVRQLIGDDIELSILRAASPGAVRADLGQLEQVIMNLIVNSRSAMPAGGKLTIATGCQELEGAWPGDAKAPPRRYMTLTITDTGCGMDDETLRRLFEPFFTTKEQGKGLGLGLSTSYGIVKQCGGHIAVTSRPGQGATFKVYLPRVEVANESATGPTDLDGDETVLLVEDDDKVRNLVGRILSRRGYRVLAAADGEEALALARSHLGKIDLVLSDVIMPGASGPEVVGRLLQLSDKMRALLMSGYTDDALLRDGPLPGGTGFIQKPFSPDSLAKKIRQVLDA